jgi:hypothetical protein
MERSNNNTLISNYSTQSSPASKLSRIGFRLTVAAALLGGLAVSGLSSYANAQQSQSEAVAEHPNWAQLPGELIRPDCVHEIPKGARVEIGKDGDLTGDVTLNGILITHYDACPEKAVITRQGARTQGVAQVQQQAQQEETGNGWVEDDEWNAPVGGSDNIDFMGSNWTVPEYPSEVDGQVIYLANGISAQKWFLETELQWGYNGVFGGNYYEIETLLIDDSAAYFSTPVFVNPGDSLTGYSYMTKESGNKTYWESVIVDNSTGYGSEGSYWVSGQHWTWAYAGILQAYDLNACAEFPDSPRTSFSDASVAHGFPNFDYYSYPNWFGVIWGYGGPTCHFAVVAASGTLDY